MKKILILLFFFLSNNVLAVEFKGKFIQGHFIIGKTESGTKVLIDKKEVRTSDDGYFVFGIGRDRKYDVVITLNKDGNKQKIVKKVLKRKYNIQRIDGLPEEQVTPPEEVYVRIKKENKLIGDAKAIDSNLTYFKNKFIVPIENTIISGVYGSRRILNGEPKWPHYGLDFAADEGTTIKAMLDGIVTLAEPDLYYTTGRATGAHLDVRLNWFQTRLDPETVLNIK